MRTKGIWISWGMPRNCSATWGPSNFAISFSIISVLTGAASLYGHGRPTAAAA